MQDNQSGKQALGIGGKISMHFLQDVSIYRWSIHTEWL